MKELLRSLRLWWHGFNTRRKMNRVFSRGQDPYGYAQSPYELARLAAMEAALKPGRTMLEVGCAEGVFTERLARLAPTVVALDISAVALERARRRAGCETVNFEETDLRRWQPAQGQAFDGIVLGDVLYYLDKPLVQEEFRETFPRVASWLTPGGRLLLAHGFAGPQERTHRESFRKLFEAQGLSLMSEQVVGEGAAEGKVCCLLSVLEKPASSSR